MAKLTEAVDAGLSPHHPGIAIERRSFVQLFKDAFHFLDAHVVIKSCESEPLSPKEIKVPFNLLHIIFFRHDGCSYVVGQPPIEYMEIISTSGKFISEKLKHLAGRSALAASRKDNGND